MRLEIPKALSTVKYSLWNVLVSCFAIFHRCDTACAQASATFSHIADAFASFGDAVLNQIFDQIRRKVQFLIKVKDSRYFRRGQRFPQVLFCNEQKLHDVLFLAQFLYHIRCQCILRRRKGDFMFSILFFARYFIGGRRGMESVFSGWVDKKEEVSSW